MAPSLTQFSWHTLGHFLWHGACHSCPGGPCYALLLRQGTKYDGRNSCGKSLQTSLYVGRGLSSCWSFAKERRWKGLRVTEVILQHLMPSRLESFVFLFPLYSTSTFPEHYFWYIYYTVHSESHNTKWLREASVVVVSQNSIENEVEYLLIFRKRKPMQCCMKCTHLTNLSVMCKQKLWYMYCVQTPGFVCNACTVASCTPLYESCTSLYAAQTSRLNILCRVQ